MRTGTLSGREAFAILITEIGDEIGPRRLRELEVKVRATIATIPREDRTGETWIRAVATVIVADDDTKADRAFARGIRKIREAAAER